MAHDALALSAPSSGLRAALAKSVPTLGTQSPPISGEKGHPDLMVALRSVKAAFIRFTLVSILMIAIASATAIAEEAVRPRVTLTPEAAAIHAAGMLFDG
ncbi:MAG TPA: hypothetical protein PLR25_04120, partial [Planctomycetaceae bacterium]|nr:hypothetical protein [Planctomycetaceae bacterium]